LTDRYQYVGGVRHLRDRGNSPPPHGATALSVPGPPHYRGFTITLRHTTFGTIPLDGWSARHTDFTTHTHTHIQRTEHNTYIPSSVCF
jgi:hypothetical protein